MISKKAKYAISALVYIAKYKESEPISAARISEDQKIPLKFLESILTELKNARILKSRKGKFGGYLLNASPDEIHMAKVMRLFDGAIAILPCVTYDYYEKCEECTNEETCGIREIALEIRNETVNRLKTATLTNILEREARLVYKKG